jgi:uncharacterized protein (UPF0333 family)
MQEQNLASLIISIIILIIVIVLIIIVCCGYNNGNNGNNGNQSPPPHIQNPGLAAAAAYKYGMNKDNFTQCYEVATEKNGAENIKSLCCTFLGIKSCNPI